MEQIYMGRMCVGRQSDKLLEAAKGLEEFAAAFPESRLEMLELIEQYSGQTKEHKKELGEIADRIAVMDMLEILQGK